MRTITIKKFIIVTAFLIVVSACQKDLQPYDSKSDQTALTTLTGLQMATYGTYSKEVNLNWTYTILSEFPSDNCALASSSTNDMLQSYNYQHFPNMGNPTSFWQDLYSMIFCANAIIGKINDGESAVLDQLKGENLYLRAMSHFNLVRVFGRPYPQGSGENPGIPIKDNIINDLPARSTVKQVYDFVINDLLKATTLMTVSKDSRFASKEVAYALLSRVYLYKEDNANAVLYATKVINSGRYQLVATENYKTYFIYVYPESNPETIFAIRLIPANSGALGSLVGMMFYNDPVTRATGWAQMSASVTYMKLLDKYPQDVRHSFIEPLLKANGEIEMLYGGQTPAYMVNKFNRQDGIINLASPVYLRLAEMYLNRAEANAKIGNLQEAIDDVNILRRRAGLSDSALYTLNDLKGLNSVLDVVLQERRLELAFEGHRTYDLFRNNLPMIRDYPGYHGLDHIHQTINPSDNRVVHFIPEYETNLNPNLTQNP